MTNKVVVLVTCANSVEARRIARRLVKGRMAACVNIVTAPVESIYRWKGKVESAREHLLVIKTSRRRLPALQRAVMRLHSYDVPEIIALPIVAGSRGYLKWLAECLEPESGRRRMRKGTK